MSLVTVEPVCHAGQQQPEGSNGCVKLTDNPEDFITMFAATPVGFRTSRSVLRAILIVLLAWLLWGAIGVPAVSAAAAAPAAQPVRQERRIVREHLYATPAALNQTVAPLSPAGHLMRPVPVLRPQVVRR